MTESTPDAGAIEIQVGRILASQEFDATERNRRFLKYIIEETIAGRASRIKAYSIATKVFDRADNFDPQVDPIIRIEASRLRRSLERYYLTEGRFDPIRISVPKGSYIPRFEVSETGMSDAEASPPLRSGDGEGLGAQLGARLGVPGPRVNGPATYRKYLLALLVLLAIMATWAATSWFNGSPLLSGRAQRVASARHEPKIFVAPLESDENPSTDPDLPRGLTREIINGLAQFEGVVVYGVATSVNYPQPLDFRKLASDLGVDYVLTGGVSLSRDNLAVTTSLVEASSGRYLWSEKFAGNLTAANAYSIKDNIAAQVVDVVAQPYGVVFNERVKEIEGKVPEDLTSYECVLRFYVYSRKLNLGLFEPVRSCLERAVSSEPDYADAAAALAIIYADAYRFGFGQKQMAFDPLARALELARHSLEIAPDSVLGYQAFSLVHWLKNDVPESLRTAERGLALNPNSAGLMADLGLRYSMRGEWGKGLPLVEASYARDPGQPTSYRLAFFLHDYATGQYEDALTEAKMLDFPDLIYAHMALAISYAEVGRQQEARDAVKAILSIDPGYGDHAIQDLKKHNLAPELLYLVLDGLRKAGLAIRDFDKIPGPNDYRSD